MKKDNKIIIIVNFAGKKVFCKSRKNDCQLCIKKKLLKIQFFIKYLKFIKISEERINCIQNII